MSGPSETTPRKRILVVDDELSVRELLADALDAYGYPVRIGWECRRGAPGRGGGLHGPRAVDIDMPARAGSISRRIKKRDPDIDVIMVTGVVDVDTRSARSATARPTTSRNPSTSRK